MAYHARRLSFANHQNGGAVQAHSGGQIGFKQREAIDTHSSSRSLSRSFEILVRAHFMPWALLRKSFQGGTLEAKSLFKRRVRFVKDGVFSERLDEKRSIAKPVKKGTEGYIGYVPEESKQTVVIAIAKLGPLPSSFDALLRSGSVHPLKLTWQEMVENLEIFN